MPRSRDIVLLLVALVGILISGNLMCTQSSRTDDREAREKATRQLHEARQKALEAQQHLEAQRAQVVREAEERTRQQAESRRRQEQHEHHRRTQLDALRQAGIRSVERSAAAADTFRSVGVWLQVDSVPDGADVYLNWTRKGRTPLWLNGVSIAGFLVIVKDGQQPWFGDIDYREAATLAVTLPVATASPRTHLLLVIDDSAPSETFAILRAQLTDHGFTVPRREEADVFQRTATAASGLTHPAFRSWARAHFNTRALLQARVRVQRRGLGEQSRVLTDAMRVVVEVDCDVYDLRTGGHETTVSVTASAFATDHTHGLQEALKKAATAAAAALRTRLSE